MTSLVDRWSQSMMDNYGTPQLALTRGAGAVLTDEEGNEYLDFLAGISVLNVGHCHPGVVAAVCEQAGRLLHATNLYYTEPALRLSAALAESSLGGKVFLCNSGAEANEAAIKLVRRARPGGEVVVVQDAFHGRTYGALSATPQEAKQAPFAPLVPGFVVVPKDPEALAAAVTERTAAVLLEPIQGETGINILSDEVLHGSFGFHYLETCRAWLDPKACSSIARYLRFGFAFEQLERINGAGIGEQRLDHPVGTPRPCGQASGVAARRFQGLARLHDGVDQAQL